jgi:hypothetical protein
MIKSYKITFIWDDEACVWIATSDDVRGLVLEDESFDALLCEVQLAVPTLLNFDNEHANDITLDFVAHRQKRLVYSG